MINTAPSASNSVLISGLWQTEKWFWYNKTNFSSHVSHCCSVVKELPARADKLGSTPGDAVFCFFVLFFFCLVFVFWHNFSFRPVFLYSYCWPCRSWTLINIYFMLKSEVLFWKRDFKNKAEPLICILAKLTARKNHKLPRHVPPLKQLNFFKC